MRPSRCPLGFPLDELASTVDIIPVRAKDEGGFSDFHAAPLVFPFGTALSSEWVPDEAERRALASGAKLRILQLGKFVTPLRVVIVPGHKGDAPVTMDESRLARIQQRIEAETPIRLLNPDAETRRIVAIVFEETAK